MNSTNLLMVKHALSHFKLSHAKDLLSTALEMDNAYLIKNYIDDEMRKAGLRKIVRSRRYS